MANVSYRRFRNTLPDLKDCRVDMNDLSNMCPEEYDARLELISLAVSIALEFGHEVDQPVKKEVNHE